MTSFSLWRHSLLSWPHPPLRTYERTYVCTDTLPRHWARVPKSQCWTADEEKLKTGHWFGSLLVAYCISKVTNIAHLMWSTQVCWRFSPQVYGDQTLALAMSNILWFAPRESLSASVIVKIRLRELIDSGEQAMLPVPCTNPRTCALSSCAEASHTIDGVLATPINDRFVFARHCRSSVANAARVQGVRSPLAIVITTTSAVARKKK